MKNRIGKSIRTETKMKIPLGYAGGLAGLFLMATLGGCSTMEITSAYDPEIQFSGFKTYAWIPGPQKTSGTPRLEDPIIRARIRQAVEDELAAKGYSQTKPGRSDFLVGYHGAVKGKLTDETMNEFYGSRPGGSWRPGTALGLRREYAEGSLILDIIDPITKDLLWRGSALVKLDINADPLEKEIRVKKGVKALLKRFPPKDLSDEENY